jgi:catechol 2,3-dioxygenase-like lactoylglutathione lyase family enzyme
MIPTYGLTHIALTVKDLDRASLFYQTLFGAKEMYRNENFIQLQTPNNQDILVLEKGETPLGKSSGILHFGFRLLQPLAIEILTQEVKNAGGQIKESVNLNRVNLIFSFMILMDMKLKSGMN